MIQPAVPATPLPANEACLTALASQDDSYVYVGVAACHLSTDADADAAQA